MKYFTPELYLRFNSPDPAVEAVVEEEWEQAITDYRRHLASIAARLPDGLKSFAERDSLHDASFLGITTVPAPQSTEFLTCVSLKQDELRVYLLYFSREEPFIDRPRSNWRFSKEEVHWLYDEVDVSDEALTHEILLSDGRVLAVRFHTFDVVKIPAAIEAADREVATV